MRKESVSLKNRVHLPLIRRYIVDTFSVEVQISAVRFNKARNNSQGCGLSATAGSEQGHKFFVFNRKTQIIKDLFPIKSNRNIFKLNDVFRHPFISLQDKKNYCIAKGSPKYNNIIAQKI